MRSDRRILTTSNDELKLARCYGLGAAGCIVKPIDFSCFVEAVRRIGLYWTLCETPRPRRRTVQPRSFTKPARRTRTAAISASDAA